jgi:hypothetical protein
VLRGTFGPKREEENVACSIYEGDYKYVKILVRKPQDHLKEKTSPDGENFVHYRVHKSPQLDPSLNQIHPIYKHYSFKIHINIILQSTPISP